MISFGSGVSAAPSAAQAATEAATDALTALRRSSSELPKLAIVFASASYEDVERAARAVRAVVGDAQITGGTSGGCVFDGSDAVARGVSVVLLAGDSIEVEARTAALQSAECLEAVAASDLVARAGETAALRGLGHFACLVFAPGIRVDGEALVAAVRKGAGARAQLAGALTGDDLAFEHPQVFFGDELREDCAVITGIFTEKALGISARHGWAAAGPEHTVTRADGVILSELDGRPALDVWVEDARAAGGDPPTDHKDLALYFANHFELGIVDSDCHRSTPPRDPRELVVRAPFAIRPDGSVRLSASVPEGSHVCIVGATRADLLSASAEAATAARERAGGAVVGALVVACTGRLVVLGETFREEPLEIHQRLGAPIGGACAFGEIARTLRDRDAFFNTTAVVVAFPE